MSDSELIYLRIIHRHFVRHLADRYRDGERVYIAGLCDETLDRSGRLLGEVRNMAAQPSPQDTEDAK